jgi:hypothetical protein
MSGRWYGGPTLHAAIAVQTNPHSVRALECHFMRATLSLRRLTGYGRIVKVP